MVTTCTKIKCDRIQFFKALEPLTKYIKKSRYFPISSQMNYCGSTCVCRMFCIKDVILNILEDSGLYWMTFLSTPRQLYLRMVMWRHDTHSHIHWENHRKILRKLCIFPKNVPNKIPSKWPHFCLFWKNFLLKIGENTRFPEILPWLSQCTSQSRAYYLSFI